VRERVVTRKIVLKTNVKKLKEEEGKRRREMCSDQVDRSERN
jgi:hypothetical protein